MDESELTARAPQQYRDTPLNRLKTSPVIIQKAEKFGFYKFTENGSLTKKYPCYRMTQISKRR